MRIITPRQLSFNFEQPAHDRLRLPLVARRIAIRAGISPLHALAFVSANGIGPTGAR